MESASGSMAKRFQYLFVLPKSLYSIVASYLTIVSLLAFCYEYCFGLQLPFSIIMLAFIIIIQGLVLQTLRIISPHLSPIATVRRIAASLSIVNGIWLVTTLLILFAKGFNPSGASYSLTFTSFVSLAFGILIFWPVFTESVWLAIEISALNMLPLILRFSLLTAYSGSPILALPFALGLGFLVVMLITLNWINGAAKKHLTVPSFKLLKAFLDAWTNLNGQALESMLTTFGEEGSVSTYLLEFSTEAKEKVALVVPEVHPGPFAPVGAFDLPGKMYWYLKQRGYDEVFVLHGAVDHSFNLVSSQDVEHYLAQLTIPPTEGIFSNKLSSPLVRESGDVVVTGIRFGDSLCLFISVPKGSEDYPSSFREAVKNLCAKIGYRRVILVDAHNSIGDNPSDALQSDALEGIKYVASELFSAPQYETNFGFASKQFTFTSVSGADIAAGGIGCLVLDVNGVNHAIVWADSNNAVVGLRHEIDMALAEKSIHLLEFCTSDSHFNAARIRNRRGYLVLGETTAPAKVANDMSELAEQARMSMGKASIGFYEWVSHVRLPKAGLLSQMEATLTDALNATKRGLLVIFGLLFAELVMLLIL
jgi:putative membrane protein